MTNKLNLYVQSYFINKMVKISEMYNFLPTTWKVKLATHDNNITFS